MQAKTHIKKQRISRRLMSVVREQGC